MPEGQEGGAATPLSAARASTTAVAGVLAAVGLVLLMVAWAALIGPQEVLREEGSPPSYPSLSPSTPTASASASAGAGTPASGGQQDILFTVVSIAAVLLASIFLLAVLIAALYWLLTRDWRRAPRDPEPADVDFDPIEAPGWLAAALLDHAADQRAALAEGTPRNGVVACWHAFEEGLATRGVRRREWETSSEFTLRVFDAVAADPAAVQQLGELYRAARHSAHELTEDDRQRAVELLDAIHRSLGDRAGARG